MSDRPLIRLTLKPLPDDVPEAIRLRHVLKRLLRTYGFRCMAIDNVADARTPPAARRDATGNEAAE